MIIDVGGPNRRRETGRGLLENLRLADFVTFFAVQREGSVSGAARALGVSPSHVSKTVARLEKQLHLVLLNRGVHGVSVTDEALRIMPDLEEVVRRLQRVIEQPQSEQTRTLTVAGPSWLIMLLLPVIAESQQQLRFCALELPPATLRAHAAENFFDLSLIAGRANLPSSWHRTQVGEVRRVLLARPSLASRLQPMPARVERVLEIPFITPVYSSNGQFVQADDDCPVSYSERRLGHRVQTFHMALELAARIDQVVFGPLIAARHYVEQDRLVEIPVHGWKSNELLSVACNPERVLAHEHAAIIEATRRALRELR
jgi:DNA-binding transcriptional LysR family regulator